MPRNRQIEYQLRIAEDPNYNKRRHQRESKYSKYRSDAKYRHIDFDLTREQFETITARPCYYCGGFTEGRTQNGLDRITSKRGYVSGNIRSCCKRCNIGKLNYSAQSYVKHCLKVAQHQSTTRCPKHTPRRINDKGTRISTHQ